MSDIERRLDELRAFEPLHPEQVDYSFRDADRLRQVFGRTFAYFGRVENEVSAGPLLEMLPRLGTSYGGHQSYGRDFLDIWVAQERAHGAIFDRLQTELGMTPIQPEASAPLHNRILGRINSASPWFHGVFEMIYLTRGAMHERLTYQGYKLMAQRLEDLGETALRTTMVKPIIAQEAGHLGFYRLAAKELKRHLSNMQLSLARKISIATYAPVGAGSKKHKPEFGHAAAVLAGEGIVAFAERVHDLGQELLSGDDQVLDNFVLAAINKCMAA